MILLELKKTSRAGKFFAHRIPCEGMYIVYSGLYTIAKLCITILAICKMCYTSICYHNFFYMGEEKTQSEEVKPEEAKEEAPV